MKSVLSNSFLKSFSFDLCWFMVFRFWTASCKSFVGDISRRSEFASKSAEYVIYITKSLVHTQEDQYVLEFSSTRD